VLVALAVVALVVGVALEQSRISVVAARRAEAQSAALAVGQNKISELALASRWTEGEESGEEGGFAWRLRIRPAREFGERAVGGGSLRLWHVEMTVAGGPASLSLETLRLVEQRP